MSARTETALLHFPKSSENTEPPAQGALAEIIVFRRRSKIRKRRSTKSVGAQISRRNR
jgi:hypothetical protein